MSDFEQFKPVFANDDTQSIDMQTEFAKYDAERAAEDAKRAAQEAERAVTTNQTLGHEDVPKSAILPEKVVEFRLRSFGVLLEIMDLEKREQPVPPELWRNYHLHIDHAENAMLRDPSAIQDSIFTMIGKFVRRRKVA